MSQMTKLPFVGQVYAPRLSAAAAQASINIMPQTVDDPNESGRNGGAGKNSQIMVGCPGYHQIIQLSYSTIRGLWSGGGRLFVVAGNHILEVTQGSYVGGNPSSGAGAVVQDFALPDSSDNNPAQMFGNGNQLMIVANGFAYIWNPPSPPIKILFEILGDYTTTDGATIHWADGDQFTPAINGIAGTFNGQTTVVTYVSPTEVTVSPSIGIESTAVPFNAPAGDPLTATTGAYLDSTFYVQRAVPASPPDVGRQVNFSAVNDGTSWNPLDFFSKESYPDHITSILADREQLYVFGEESAEVWQNNPSTGLIGRVVGAAIRQGSLGHWGPVSLGGNIFLLGGGPSGNPVAYMLNGFTPQRISTHGVEAQWAQQVPSLANPIAYGTLEDGHWLWVINFSTPGGGGQALTWVYDMTAGEWHQRANWEGSAFGPYSCQFHTYIGEWGAAGMHIAGDPAFGNIYEMNLSYADQNGFDTKWVRVIPYLYNAGNRMFGGRMNLEMAVGTAPSSEPSLTVTRDYSDDQGHTFVNPQPAIEGIGAQGAFTTQVFWPTSGSWTGGRLFRFSGVGSAPVCLIDLQMELDLGLV